MLAKRDQNFQANTCMEFYNQRVIVIVARFQHSHDLNIIMKAFK